MPPDDPVGAHAVLTHVLKSHDELRWALMATSAGDILYEVGSRAFLAYQFADRIADAETLRWFHDRVLDVEKLSDPRFVPQCYAQGEYQALYGRIGTGELVVAVGMMPADVLAGPPDVRAHWSYDFQQRVWKTVSLLFTLPDTALDPHGQ